LDEWNNSKFRNVISSQPYDVEIQSADLFLDYFEIASTTFDDGELFRMNEFLEKQMVNLTSKLVRNGKEIKSGARMVTSIQNLARERNESINAVAQKVESAIKN
jgi:hypothetical protein